MPSLSFSFWDYLRLVGRRKYRTSFDCQFARHFSHPHESFSVRVWAEKVPQCIGRDWRSPRASGQRRRRRRHFFYCCLDCNCIVVYCIYVFLFLSLSVIARCFVSFILVQLFFTSVFIYVTVLFIKKKKKKKKKKNLKKLFTFSSLSVPTKVEELTAGSDKKKKKKKITAQPRWESNSGSCEFSHTL